MRLRSRRAYEASPEQVRDPDSPHAYSKETRGASLRNETAMSFPRQQKPHLEGVCDNVALHHP